LGSMSSPALRFFETPQPRSGALPSIDERAGGRRSELAEADAKVCQ